MREILDNPVVWEISRLGLNLTFRLYQKRIKAMRDWGLLEGGPSIIEFGCGIGTYSNITEGEYLGVDLNPKYIDYARKKERHPKHSFRCVDATTVLNERTKFDLVLMVDFLHHISDSDSVDLLKTSAQLATRFVVNFEPVTLQPNPVGRWIVEHDRGRHVRPLDNLHQLFEDSRLTIVESRELRLGPINTRAILARPQGGA